MYQKRYWFFQYAAHARAQSRAETGVAAEVGATAGQARACELDRRSLAHYGHAVAANPAAAGGSGMTHTGDIRRVIRSAGIM